MVSGNRMACVFLGAVFLGLSFVCGAAASRNRSAAKAPAVAANENLVQYVNHSAQLSRLRAAIRESGVSSALEGRGPITLFAPSNEAFDSLPAGALDNLMEPRNRAMLAKILKYYVVSGHITTSDMKEMVRKSHGLAKLKTLEGGDLRIELRGGRILLIDQKGGEARITMPDISGSNGLIQGIGTVLMPR